MAEYLQEQGLQGASVAVQKGLHLKSSVTCIEDRVVLATTTFASEHRDTLLCGLDVIEIPNEEGLSANVVWVNGRVLM